VSPFLQVIQSLGVTRLSAIVGAGAVVLGSLIFIYARLDTPDMALLYADLDTEDSTEIIGYLESQAVSYELRGRGGEVLVPRDQVGPMRLAMAQLGIPSSGTLGYEIFDRDQSIGTSSFVQEVNRLRALEGELARTIASLTPVKGARVHLVLPRRELFSRERQEATASVILRMKGANRLDRNQVLAVQHLIAAAVPQLKPGAISIIDDRGTLLSRGSDDGTTIDGETAEEMRAGYESRLARRLESLLEKSVGIGKVRAEVRAVMDFSQQVIEEEEFNPEGQVLRSSEAIEESSLSEDANPENVSVDQNLPDPPEALGGATSREQANRTEERSNFEINRKATNTIRAPGRIQQLSVAVLVDGHYREADDGNVNYEARATEEMEQIEKLVRSAIGYGADGRDDTVEVVNMQFAEVEVLSDEEESLFFGMSTTDVRSLTETLLLGIFGILVILLVVRPLLAKLMEVAPSALADMTGANAGDLMLADQTAGAGGPAQLVGPDGEEGMMEPVDEDFEAMIDISQVEGRVKASSLRKIGEIIEKHPEEAVAILRTWMNQEQ